LRRLPETESSATRGGRPAALERALGHRFERAALLEQALTHRSFGSPHNERLEFLGDGVLGCVIAEALIVRFPDLSEGQLSRLRASLVREAALAARARELGLQDHLRLGEGEAASGGATRPSILADAMEALFGAVFLDGGYAAARAVVLRVYGEALSGLDARALGKDPKTQLQEFLQARRRALPQYRVVATRGAAHRQIFEVECVVVGACAGAPEQRASGTGSSRRLAEQQAAEAMLRLLGE